MNTYAILKFIESAKKICLLTHKNPDADALASTSVLKNFLQDKLTAEIDIFADCNSIPENCKFLADIINPYPKTYDCAIMMDCPKSARLGEFERLYKSAKLTISIDHHITNDLSSSINIVENVSSTCEIVYRILTENKYIISPEDKSKLYAGIITDTNNFSVGNITGKTMRVVSEIIDDIDYEQIHSNFFSNNSIKHMKLLSHAIKNEKFFHNNEILISFISKSEYKKLDLSESDFIGIINKLATTSNIKLISLIYPSTNGYYVSMRARRGYDVSEIAKHNGGGGHSGAAAYLSKDRLKKIKNYIIEKFSQQL